jgi:hypothetical protein
VKAIDIGSLAASTATVIAAVAVVWTVIIYHRQLQAMIKARQMDSLMVIMKYVEDLELRRARYFMFEHGKELRHLFDAPFSWELRRAIDMRVRELSENQLGLHNVDLVINTLNNVCFLIRYGYAPPEAVDAFLKNSLLHAWHAFEPYIYHRRRRPDEIGETSQYAVHLEWVVQNMCRRTGKNAASSNSQATAPRKSDEAATAPPTV